MTRAPGTCPLLAERSRIARRQVLRTVGEGASLSFRPSRPARLHTPPARPPAWKQNIREPGADVQDNMTALFPSGPRENGPDS